MFAAGKMLMTSGFSPLQLSPSMWLSDTGSDAAQWDDLSGNGRHATQGTASARPAIISSAINGRQVRRFDGGDSLIVSGTASSMKFLHSAQSSIFVVFKNAITTPAMILSTNEGSSGKVGFFTYCENSTTVTHFISKGVSGVRTSLVTWTPYVTSSLSLLSIVADVAAAAALRTIGYRNGTQQPQVNALNNAASTADSFGDLRIGDYNSAVEKFNGDIAEIIIFPTALSIADRQAVESYLNSKYLIY